MSISHTLATLRQQLLDVKLVVVTKKHPAEAIKEVIQAGVKDLGENRLQEIEEKYEQDLLQLMKEQGVKLHFIGQIQSNKIKKIVQYCDVIQSVCSIEQAEKIQAAAEELEKNIEVFIQLNLTEEDQKQGFPLIDDHKALFEFFTKLQELKALSVRGFMCMGKANDSEVTRTAFKTCKALADAFNLPECSMGMSDDYQIALEEGSTMLRLGSVVFENSSQEN